MPGHRLPVLTLFRWIPNLWLRASVAERGWFCCHVFMFSSLMLSPLMVNIRCDSRAGTFGWHVAGEGFTDGRYWGG